MKKIEFKKSRDTVPLIVLDTNICFVERVKLITSRLKLHMAELAFK